MLQPVHLRTYFVIRYIFYVINKMPFAKEKLEEQFPLSNFLYTPGYEYPSEIYNLLLMFLLL